MGTSATPLLSGEEEEEQLLTCLSAQLFVSRSPRETEAAGSRKSCPAGPARLLPRPYVLTPKQNRQPRRDWKGPPSPPQKGFFGALVLVSAVQTLVCHPRPRRGQHPHWGSGRGRVLTGRQRPCQGQGPGGWAAFSLGAASSLEAGSSLGSRVLPGGRVVQGSTPGLALAQTVPGPCLLCLPCELPSPWGQSR